MGQNPSCTYNVFIHALDPLEAGPVLVQVAAERLQSLERLFLLGVHRLLLGQSGIVVDGARKRRERRAELGLQVRRRRCCVGELVQVFADRARLPQRRIEQRILRNVSIAIHHNRDDDCIPWCGFLSYEFAQPVVYLKASRGG